MKKLILLFLLLILNSCGTFHLVTSQPDPIYTINGEVVQVDTIDNLYQLDRKFRFDDKFRWNFAHYAMNQDFRWHTDFYWNNRMYSRLDT